MNVRRFAAFAFLVGLAQLALLMLGRAELMAAQSRLIASLAPVPSTRLEQNREMAEGKEVEGLVPVSLEIGSTGSPVSADAFAATDPDAENVELVGHIGGPTRAVFVQDSYAYIGEGPKLIIYDISEPISLTVVGKTLPLPGVARGVYVSGTYAYIAADEAGLQVVDVSNPRAPSGVGSTPMPGEARGIAVAGHYAYITAGYEDFWIVDISDPANPQTVAHHPAPWRAIDVAVAGNYAYVVGNSGYGPRYAGWLRVLDVSNPLIPVEVGFCDTPGDAYSVVVSGTYAYVADGNKGLQVLDVSTPTNPTCEVGAVDTPGYAMGVAVEGNYAYVTDGPDGYASYYDNSLRVVDVSIPTDPKEVGSIDKSGSAQSVATAGTHAYIANGSDGLWVVDVTTPTDPKDVGSYGIMLGYARDVEVVEGYVYLADYNSGLRVVDATDPTSPVPVGFSDKPGSPYGLTVSGTLAYLTDGPNGGLQVVYVSDPTAPVPLGFSPKSGYAEDVTISGSYAYVAANELWVVDVTYPTIPTHVISCDTPRAYGVTVSGDYAYVAANDLWVVDISVPTTPTCDAGFYDTPGWARGVTLAENFAYVAAWHSGLLVVDVSVPTSPTMVGSCDTPGNAYEVAVADSYAYIADREGGLRVVDVSIPTDPKEVGFYDTPGDAYGVATEGNYVYVADYDGGLFILRYTAEPHPTLYPISNPNGGGNYNMDWSDVAGVLTYTLQEDDNAGFTSPTTRYTGGASQYGISGQAPGVWYYRVKVATASGESGWSNVESTTVAPPPEGDDYEPDDTCAQANALATDGMVQQHTFHQQADEDWAYFTVVSGTTYVVQAASTSTGADLELELYDACDGSLQGYDDNAFGADARLVFTATSSGTTYVKALNHDPAVYGPDVTYELSARQLFGGVALIVAGHDDSYNLQDNILYCTNTAYRTFLLGGLPKDNLRYLSDVDGDARTDADGDGVSDVYADSSSANVQMAITSWAASLADANTPLYLYLMDHGAVDAFLTDGSGDTIASDELDSWLTALEDATGAPVNVIYEACHSGSFIEAPKEISKQGRVIIASTGSLNNAYPSRYGALFSDAFFTQLRQNSDLHTSFEKAKRAVEATGLWQTPWLDDNGDGIPNGEEDGSEARRRGPGSLGFNDRPPAIDGLTPPSSIVDGDGMLRAQVRDDSGREVNVWAVVYPPSFEEPAPTEDGTIPELGLPRVLLSDSDGDREYVGVYEDFTEDGAYHVVVYAQDTGGNHALPAVTRVQKQWPVYLPLVVRQ